MSCGKKFNAVIDDDTGHILIGAYFGEIINPKDRRFFGRWSTRYIPLREQPSISGKANIFQRFMERRFWWYSLPEEKCTMPNWKKPFWMLFDWIYDKIHPPDMVEMWECSGCYPYRSSPRNGNW